MRTLALAAVLPWTEGPINDPAVADAVAGVFARRFRMPRFRLPMFGFECRGRIGRSPLGRAVARAGGHLPVTASTSMSYELDQAAAAASPLPGERAGVNRPSIRGHSAVEKARRSGSTGQRADTTGGQGGGDQS